MIRPLVWALLNPRRAWVVAVARWRIAAEYDRRVAAGQSAVDLAAPAGPTFEESMEALEALGFFPSDFDRERWRNAPPEARAWHLENLRQLAARDWALGVPEDEEVH